VSEQESGLVTGELAARLLMLTRGQFEDYARKGWFKPVSKSPARYQLVEVVQGYLKALKHEQDRPRTQTEAADHIMLSSRRFRELVEEGVLPRVAAGEGYDLGEIRSKYILYQRAQTSGHAHGSNTNALTAERAGLAKEQREAIALKNAVARREYAPVTMMIKGAEIIFSTFRERCLAIPGKIATSCEMRSRGEVEAIMRDELYEALDELSRPILNADRGEVGLGDGGEGADESPLGGETATADDVD
jgi:hypothetical protein